MTAIVTRTMVAPTIRAAISLFIFALMRRPSSSDAAATDNLGFPAPQYELVHTDVGLSKKQQLTGLFCDRDARKRRPSRLVATAEENRGRVDGQKRHRLGDVRSRIYDLVFWLHEHRPRLSI